MVVDRAAMAERDVTEGEIADDITAESGETVAERIRNADHTLDF